MQGGRLLGQLRRVGLVLDNLQRIVVLSEGGGQGEVSLDVGMVLEAVALDFLGRQVSEGVELPLEGGNHMHVSRDGTIQF